MRNLPSTIGRYKVEKIVGQGGMGILYRAVDPKIADRAVAIKVLRVDDRKMRLRFEREARMIGLLEHPNIVTVYDVGEHEGQPFIAMRFVPGDTLAGLIERQVPMPLAERLVLVEQLCDGLAYAHERGVIHRDVKPANLMVDEGNGRVVIVDFGIARALSSDTGITQLGAILGTPRFMAPEQLQGGAVDHRSDIYAVGLVLYEFLSYRPAFQGDATPIIAHRILFGSPQPLAEMCPALPPALTAIVERAIDKSPDQRYQSLLDMGQEIASVRHQLGDDAFESAVTVSRGPAPLDTVPEHADTGRLSDGVEQTRAQRRPEPGDRPLAFEAGDPATEPDAIGSALGGLGPGQERPRAGREEKDARIATFVDELELRPPQLHTGNPEAAFPPVGQASEAEARPSSGWRVPWSVVAIVPAALVAAATGAFLASRSDIGSRASSPPGTLSETSYYGATEQLAGSDHPTAVSPPDAQPATETLNGLSTTRDASPGVARQPTGPPPDHGDTVPQISKPAVPLSTPPAGPVRIAPPAPAPTSGERLAEGAPTPLPAAPSPRAPTPGGLRGMFRDPSGPVAGLTVRLVGQHPDATLETVTSDGGAYELLLVPPGEYTLMFLRDQETVHARPALSIREGRIRTLLITSPIPTTAGGSGPRTAPR